MTDAHRTEGSSEDASTVEPNETPPPRTLFGRVRGVLGTVAKWLFRLTITYLLIVVVGLVPVNNDFKPTAKDGVRIFVQSSEVHADFILPIESDVINWADTPLFDKVPGNFVNNRWNHVAIGWGDRGFYLQTPRWQNLSPAKVANAMLLPSRSVMHLSIATLPQESSSCKAVTISREQYAKLVRYIQSAFVDSESSEEGQFAPVPIASEYVHPAWGSNNFFFEATGSYHVFNTCNCWVGGGLKETGVRTAWFTPLPKTVFLHWP